MSAKRERNAWLGLGAAVLLLGAAVLVPWVTGWEVHARAPRSAHPLSIPPLHGYVDVKAGPGTLPAVLVALLGWRYAATLARSLPWRPLLAASYAAALAWLLSLALVDGTAGLTRALGKSVEYLPAAREVDGVAALLEGFVDRIPVGSEDVWQTHVAGHPPGALLFFVVLVRLGLGGDLAAGMVVTSLAATIPIAVLITLRTLGSETGARTAAPFLVLSPAAVFLAVSADAVFTAVAAWGVAALALGAIAVRRSQGIAWTVLAGLLLGCAVMMSYGLPLMGILAVAVLVLAGRQRADDRVGAVQTTVESVLIAGPAALAVVLAFAWNGFAWWEAFPVLRERYWDGVASIRPASYWLWANLGALVVSAGPLVGAGLAGAASARDTDRNLVGLAGAAALMVVLADLSLMSKAEVERIWLPFVPWLTLAAAVLPARWRATGLAVQLGTALLVQHLLYTSW